MISLKSPAEIEKMRAGGKILAEILKGLPEIIRPGISTAELDRWAEAIIRSRKAQPAFKGYRGYPATLCTSINEQVVHGIPSARTLNEGDIISVDVGVKLDGWYSDAAWTYPVGHVSPLAERLMQVTRESLEKAIEQARVGNYLSNIGHAVQQRVEADKFSVVRDFVGHGIGRELHEDPQVLNYGDPDRGPRLKAGMVLAIEPMVNAGDYPVSILKDRWTVVTRDKSLSAHFEHSVAVLEGGAEVLTL